MRFPGPWTDRAACKGKTDLFFPEEHDQASKLKAVAICKTCFVRPECLEYVLNNRERGIWAGMGVQAVDAERKRRRIRLDQPITR